MAEHPINCDCEECAEELVVTITLDDDSTIDCIVIATYPVNDQDYIALLPIEEDDGDDVLIFRYKELAEDEVEIDNIESEEEFQAASEEFEKMMEEIEDEEA